MQANYTRAELREKGERLVSRVTELATYGMSVERAIDYALDGEGLNVASRFRLACMVRTELERRDAMPRIARPAPHDAPAFEAVALLVPR